MTEQSKLMQQVEEIRRRAHVCPRCKGSGWQPDSEPVQPCLHCDHGQLDAPDIDALCSALTTAITHIEAIANYPLPDGRVDKDGYPLEMVYDRYAYRRMVDSYRECAKIALTDLEEVLHEDS